jgi:Uri superfamily endonuclease
MELPEDKGTYIVISSVRETKRLQIGSLGTFEITPGYYAYVGSAFGGGGLRARLGHHLESASASHWHIDYLLQMAQPIEIWFAVSPQKLEQHWADLLTDSSKFRIPIPRFGSSDYHRSRSSHLFYTKKRPAFGWFEQQIRQRFKGVIAERYLVEETVPGVGG